MLKVALPKRTELFGLTRIGSASSAAGLGMCVLLSGCSGTQSIAFDDSVVSSDTQVADVEEETELDETPAGPQSGDIDADVLTVEQELQSLEQLEGSTLLSESNVSVDFSVEPGDYRSADGSILEVESTSEDGHYVIGRIDGMSVARISLTCADSQPADLLVTDLQDRPYIEQWVPMVDRLVPALVAASGCEPALLGGPTDCLDLPDDPGACFPGDGVEE